MVVLLSQLTAWHWLILGVVLLGLELMTGSTYILWPAVSALFVGILMFIAPTMGWELQMMLFFLLATDVLARYRVRITGRAGAGDAP